jgi:hypothetical protein
VPELVSLRLTIQERSTGGTMSAPKHLRHVVVGRAPALFLIPCGDPRCTEGGHDVTSTVMDALRARRTAFEGQHECNGEVGSSPCLRVVHYEGLAEYRD